MPGISVSKIPIPFRGAGGISWQTYWTNIIMPDGHTVGWYVAGDGSATYVTKDGSDFVSEWKDLSGANHPLNQANGTNQPKWEADGILYDGIDNFLQTANFAYNQPIQAYLVFKNVVAKNNAGYVSHASSTAIYSHGGFNNLKIYAGTANMGIGDGSVPENTFIIIRYLVNGAGSYITYNNVAKITGNPGTNNGTYILLGFGNAQYTNIKLREVIFRSTDDSDATETVIYNYLANKYGFAKI